MRMSQIATKIILKKSGDVQFLSLLNLIDCNLLWNSSFEQDLAGLKFLSQFKRLQKLHFKINFPSLLHQKIFFENFSLPETIESLGLTLNNFKGKKKQKTFYQRVSSFFEEDKIPREFYDKWEKLDNLKKLEICIQEPTENGIGYSTL